MNYPGGIKKNIKTSHKNRGMGLEFEINESNQYYLVNDIAVIYKKPTPITVAKVDYPSRKNTVIKKGFFKTPSTTDYNGVYRGKYIDFEAKETTKDYFPLANIHNHQIDHLKRITDHGGIGFLIIRFSKSNETYYLDAIHLFNFLNNFTRKSIPLSYIREFGFLIKPSYNPYIDYLKIIDDVYFKGE